MSKNEIMWIIKFLQKAPDSLGISSQPLYIEFERLVAFKLIRPLSNHLNEINVDKVELYNY